MSQVSSRIRRITSGTVIVEVLSGIVHEVRTVGRNRVAVDSIKHILPRVEATLGFET